MFRRGGRRRGQVFKIEQFSSSGSEIFCYPHMRSGPPHDTPMIPHIFAPLDVVLPEGVDLFRCPNLSCSIFYAAGTLQGFYIRTKNGELISYEKEANKG